MFRLLQRQRVPVTDLLASELFDQGTFYRAFLRDLDNCTSEVIIECPFITTKRMTELLSVFKRLRARGIKIVINTRDPEDHEGIYEVQAYSAIVAMQDIGVLVLYTGGHHRKLAILDRTITWEGSLNILSYNDSCEVMRKITSTALAEQMVSFLHIEKHLKEGRLW